MHIVKKQFKQRFLYKDQKAIDSKVESAKRKVITASNAFLSVKGIFPKPPKDSEILESIKSGWSAIHNLIRKHSDFPDGDIPTIIKLWGRDIQLGTARKFLGNDMISYLNYHDNEYRLNRGAIEFNDEVVKEIETLNTYHTTHKEQNMVLEVAEKLSEALNEAFDKDLIIYSKVFRGFYDTSKYSIIKGVSKYLALDNGKVVPNYVEIRRMKLQ